MQNKDEYLFDINQAITAAQIVHGHVETNANFFKELKSKLSLIQFQTSRLLDEGYRDAKWFVHDLDFDDCEWINDDDNYPAFGRIDHVIGEIYGLCNELSTEVEDQYTRNVTETLYTSKLLADRVSKLDRFCKPGEDSSAE